MRPAILGVPVGPGAATNPWKQFLAEDDWVDLFLVTQCQKLKLKFSADDLFRGVIGLDRRR